MLEAEGLLSVQRGSRGGARIHEPSPDAAARYAGLVLEFERATLADVYDARLAIETPCAGRLARQRSPEDVARLRTAVDAAERDSEDRRRLIRHQTDFHTLVVELGGNVTLRLFHAMLRHILESANERRVGTEPQDRAHDRAFEHGVKAHHRLVDHIEAGREADASQLWTRHLTEANEYLLELPEATTVVDLLD